MNKSAETKWHHRLKNLLLLSEPLYQSIFQTNEIVISAYIVLTTCQLIGLQGIEMTTVNLKSIFHVAAYQSVFPVFLFGYLDEENEINYLTIFIVANIFIVSVFMTIHAICKKHEILKWAQLPNQILLGIITLEIYCLLVPLSALIGKTITNVFLSKAKLLTVFELVLSTITMLGLILLVRLMAANDAHPEIELCIYTVAPYNLEGGWP